MDFPLFKTKTENCTKNYNLTDPRDQADYFECKAGKEISALKSFMQKNTFIVYLLGKKNSGKGTYSKILAGLVGNNLMEHFSVGDMIRAISKEIADPQKKKELDDYLKKNYRGWIAADKLMQIIEGRDTKTLLPAELILTLIKREIAKHPKKTLFIDGFPRDMDQVSYSLFFRDLIGFRNDPDVLVFIDVPTDVIAQRIKWRRVCPICQTSRSLKLLPTSFVEYDDNKKEFFILCDNPECSGFKKQRLLPKEGDELGIDPIKDRLETDQKLMEKAMTLFGIPKIYLRNSVPVSEAKNFVDNYELTPEFEFKLENGRINISQKPWIINDDNGIASYSLMAQPVVVSLIKQLVAALGL